MTKPELVNYIRQQITAGVTQESISATLITQGWHANEIAEGFLMINTPASVVVISERPVNVKKFEILMYVCTAWVSAPFLSSLIWPPKVIFKYGISLVDEAVMILLIVLCVLSIWLAAHRRAKWARIAVSVSVALSFLSVVLVFFSDLNIFLNTFMGTRSSIDFTDLFLSIITTVGQASLAVIAMCFAFSKSANEWFAINH